MNEGKEKSAKERVVPMKKAANSGKEDRKVGEEYLKFWYIVREPQER